MEHNLSKTYDPKSFEKRIYDMWENSGAFKPSEDKNKESFTSYATTKYYWTATHGACT